MCVTYGTFNFILYKFWTVIILNNVYEDTNKKLPENRKKIIWTKKIINYAN